MIEITDGLTSVSVGTSDIPWPTGAMPAMQHFKHGPRGAGARVTVEFQRNAALPPGSVVRVRYEFESGRMREAIGLAQPTRTVARWGREVVYHYRVSQWIAPAALLDFVVDSGRYRAEALEIPSDHSAQQSAG